MRNLRLLIAIIPRENDEAFIRLFRDGGAECVFGALCEGTASRKLLNLIGLEETEKSLLYAMVTRTQQKRLMARMIGELGLDMPGCGVALSIPVGCVGGESSLRVLTGNKTTLSNEVTDMQETQSSPYELVIAIANRGYTDLVMDAARSAGARGGTVLHARGTGKDADRSFFGMTLTAEKEMVMIVTAAKERGAIMRAVMEKAGVGTPAHTILFSLPVDDVAGLHSVVENVEFTDTAAKPSEV